MDSDSAETDVDAKASSGSSFCSAAAEAVDSAETDVDADNRIKYFQGCVISYGAPLFSDH